MREYRRNHKPPSYAEAKGIKPQQPISERELVRKNKDMESNLKKQEKLLADEKEKVEILKNSLHIFMQFPERTSYLSFLSGRTTMFCTRPKCRKLLLSRVRVDSSAWLGFQAASIREKGWELLKVYHFHPHTGAYPSPTDIRQALLPESLYLIISLSSADQAVMRGFRIRQENVTEVELHIIEE